MNPVWSPAGDLVAFGLGKYFRTPGFPPSQIAVVRPDGSGFKIVVDDQQNSGFPGWSPDGKRIVFRHGKQLSIVNLADGKISPLTDGSSEDNFPQWSPKGDVIMFTTDRDAGDFEIYSIHPDGAGLKRLTNTPGNDAHSVWSPDESGSSSPARAQDGKTKEHSTMPSRKRTENCSSCARMVPTYAS